MAGRFYVTCSLGADSVSERFLALDASAKTGKPAEFRVIRYRKELCSRKDVAAALEIEANSETPLSHPHVLKLAAGGAWDGAVFFAYEKLESTSLADAWKASGRYPLEPAIAMAIGAQIIDALAYAHSGHEDRQSRRTQCFQTALQPDSVELTRGGLVKVRGFATASLAELKRPTALDVLLGRVGYLAPAILDGGKASPQTDLFSLGCLLWELLAGQPLFRRSSPEETASAVRNREVPPVSSISPLVPAEVESFVMRLLIRDPSFQFRDTGEAKAALEKALFARDAKADQAAFEAWCRAGVRPAEPKEKADARRVLAEIVGTREIQKALAAQSTAPAEPGRVAERAPRPGEGAEKPAAPDVTPWEKTKTGVKIVAEEPEEPSPKLSRRAVPKAALVGLAALAGILAILAGAWVFFPDSFSVNGVLGSAVDVAASALRGGGEAKVLPAVFAYRNRREQSRRIAVQGLRERDAENFFIACGEGGEKCHCDFFLAPDDASPSATAQAGVSRKFNYVYCELPEGATAQFVRVVADGDKPRRTNLLQIVGDLSWEQILGPTPLKQRIRWLHRYECDRTFLEGEGVDPSGGAITCGAGQHLGILSATFSYYFYKGETDHSDPGKSVDFKTGVCGITSLTKIRCHDTATPVAGLYREELAPFIVPVSLFRAPDADDPLAIMGYAAGPDTKGNCPAGLQYVKLWNAAAPSLAEPAGLPVNLTNKTGELADRVFSGAEPRAFGITRRKNRTPCDGRGDCALAAYEEPSAAASVPYKEVASLCVLPPSLLEEPPRAAVVAAKTFGATAEKVPEAVVEIHTSMTGFEAQVDGKKVPVDGGKIRVPLHRELKVDVLRTGYKTQHFTVPALESTEPRSFDVPAEKVLIGSVDLDSFPRSEVTFWLGDEKIFSGNTPVKESLPAGRYKVKFRALRSGAEAEREVVIQDGKSTVVDQIITEQKPGAK